VSTSIERFFARYAGAISADDVPAIVSCFDPPTVVVDDAATELLIDHARLAEHFTGMAERYRARGAFSATATVRGVEQLTAALCLADVCWDAFDDAGAAAPVEVETYHYLLRTVDPAEPRIVAVIVTPIRPGV
jgi:hypothetical protein